NLTPSGGSGVASITIPDTVITAKLEPGTYDVNASYSGDPNFLLGQTATSLTVSKAVASVVLASPTPASAALGSNVHLVATVNAVTGGAGTPGNTVTFFANGNQVGNSVTISGGSATLDTTAIPAGTNVQITARYDGDNHFASITSAAKSV